jgi:hypothetical protein
MKNFALGLAIAMIAVMFCQHADAQVFVAAPGVRVNVGSNRVAFVNNRFVNDRGLFRRLAVNRAIRNNSRANLLQAQAQLLRQQQLNAVAFRGNNFHRQNLQAVAFVNTRNDLANLAAFRQVQQYNDFARVAALNQAAYFDPREAFLLNNVGRIANRSQVAFIRGNHCR